MRKRLAQDQTVTGEQATQEAQRLVEFDRHFDQLVDRVDRARVSGEHWVVVALWWHAARRAYETGKLDQLAKLFRSGVPHSRQVRQMLADVFDLCRLARKGRGGQRKLFGVSAEVQKARAVCDVRLLQRAKSIDELSTDELRTKSAGLKLGLEIDDQATRAQDAEARKLGKLRNSKGRMSRADAIEQVAQHHKLEVGKLANWMDGKTGARQRHKGECQPRDFCEGGFSFWSIQTRGASKKKRGIRAAGYDRRRL
jgi:hypothetical protein